MLTTYLNFLENQNKEFSYGHNEEIGLKNVDTGYNSKYAYGVATRKVNLGRGCREGNNAFIYDCAEEDAFSEYMIQNILESCQDYKLVQKLFVLNKYSLENKIINKIGVNKYFKLI